MIVIVVACSYNTTLLASNEAHKKIVSVRISPDTITSEDAAITSDTVVSFGHPFRKDDWPANASIVALYKDKPLPTQYDIKVRHKNKSVKHAIISIQIPEIVDDMHIDIALLSSNSSISNNIQKHASHTPLNTILLNGYSLSMNLTTPDTKHNINFADLLQKSIDNNNIDYWMHGPLVTEGRVISEISHALFVILDVRVTRTGNIRSAITLSNDHLIQSSETIEYGMRITSGNNVVENMKKVIHYPHSRWYRVINSSKNTYDPIVIFDMQYLYSTFMVPPYDLSIKYNSQHILSWWEYISSNESEWSPFPIGNIHQYMPAVGYRADLGLLPGWTTAYLVSQDPRARAAMMHNARASGSIPWHFRDNASPLPPTMDKHSRLWLDPRSNIERYATGPHITYINDWFPDIAHQPSLSYIPYLITGERFFLDELIFQTSWNLLSIDPGLRQNNNKIINPWHGQVRAQAWSMRTHARAASITPDDHPLKKYFLNTLDDGFDFYIRNYINKVETDDKALSHTNNSEIYGWIDTYLVNGMVKPFMQDFFAMSVAMVGGLQYNKAKQITNYHANWSSGRYLRHEFHPRNANLYEWHVGKNKDSRFLKWEEVAQYNFAKDIFTTEPRAFPGYPESSNDFAASARAAQAMIASQVYHPQNAVAYAYVLSETKHQKVYLNSQWAIVPIFPDGSILPFINQYIASSTRKNFSGGDHNDLFYGDEQNNIVIDSSGNNYLIGLGGDDKIIAGGEFNSIHGGAGNDLIYTLGNGVFHIAGGEGKDHFLIGNNYKGDFEITIYDFSPHEDAIVFGKRYIKSFKKLLQGIKLQPRLLTIELRPGQKINVIINDKMNFVINQSNIVIASMYNPTEIIEHYRK